MRHERTIMHSSEPPPKDAAREAVDAILQGAELDFLRSVRVDVWTTGSAKRARATHLPTGMVAEAEGPGCEYVARSRLAAMVSAAPAPAWSRTVVHSGAAAGDEEVVLRDPVPGRCWVLLSPRSGHTERVPVYACSGSGPYTVLLGLPDPAAPDVRRIARLTVAHAAGDPVEVCDD